MLFTDGGFQDGSFLGLPGFGFVLVPLIVDLIIHQAPFRSARSYPSGGSRPGAVGGREFNDETASALNDVSAENGTRTAEPSADPCCLVRVREARVTEVKGAGHGFDSVGMA